MFCTDASVRPLLIPSYDLTLAYDTTGTLNFTACSVYTPPPRLLVQAGKPDRKAETFQFAYPFAIYLIFNPFNEEDSAYFPHEVCVLRPRAVPIPG